MAAVKRSLNVGVVGIGRVGGPLLTNMAFKARNGLYLQIHSRDKAKSVEIVRKLQRDGAQIAARMHNRYSTMSKWCDVIVSVVKDEAAQRAVMLESDEALLRHAKPGQIIIDHTTIGADVARECYEVAQKRGASYIDAPLSGSLAEARNGMLTVMAGGDQAAFDKTQAIIRMYAENVHYLGGPGSGAAAKAVSQALIAMNTVAAAEAVVLADAMGFRDVGKLMEVLDASPAGSQMLRRHGAAMARLLRNPDEIPTESASNVDGILHELSLARAAAPDVADTALPLLTTSRRVLAQTSQAGIGDRDLSSVVHFLEGAGHVHPPAAEREADVEEPALGQDEQMPFY